MSERKATDAQILAAIKDYRKKNWISPTVREIGELVGLSSPATVHVRLEKLVAKGKLERKAVSQRRVVYRVVS